MSKGNMLLGQARGKVGSLVFARVGGKQVTRAKAEVVKNPQTETQMVSRIILNTVAQAYSNFQPIVDHSYEGVPKGQKSMSKFMKKNIDALRSKIAQAIADGYDYDAVDAFTPIGDNTLYPNNYVMSTGSLPVVRPNFDLSSSMKAGLELSANTYQAVLDEFGLLRGDQLTFIACENVAAGKTGFFYTRVILDPTNADGSSADLSVPFIGADNAINLPSPRNEGSFGLLVFSDDHVEWNIKSANGAMYSAGIIVSRKNTDGSWLRSNCEMLTNDNATTGVLPSLQYCLDLFYAGGIDALSDMYLNNAGRGRLADGNAAANPYSVALATIDGQRILANQVKEFSTTEASVALVVTLAESSEQVGIVQLKKPNGDLLTYSGTFSDGVATLNASTASLVVDTTYTVVITKDGNQYDTPYSIKRVNG